MRRRTPVEDFYPSSFEIPLEKNGNDGPISEWARSQRSNDWAPEQQTSTPLTTHTSSIHTSCDADLGGGVCGVRPSHVAESAEGVLSSADTAGVPTGDEDNLQHVGGCGRCLRDRREAQPV